MDRSGLLIRLSEQLGSFHELQRSWARDYECAKETVARDQEDIAHKNKDIILARSDNVKATEAQRSRLAKIMQEMCVPIDEHRFREHEDAVKLERSRSRLEEQHSMVHRLVDHNHSLQESLDKTVRKFDEIAGAHAKAREELLLAQEKRAADEAEKVLKEVLNEPAEAIKSMLDCHNGVLKKAGSLLCQLHVQVVNNGHNCTGRRGRA